MFHHWLPIVSSHSVLNALTTLLVGNFVLSIHTWIQRLAPTLIPWSSLHWWWLQWQPAYSGWQHNHCEPVLWRIWYLSKRLSCQLHAGVDLSPLGKKNIFSMIPPLLNILYYCKSECYLFCFPSYFCTCIVHKMCFSCNMLDNAWVVLTLIIAAFFLAFTMTSFNIYTLDISFFWWWTFIY